MNINKTAKFFFDSGEYIRVHRNDFVFVILNTVHESIMKSKFYSHAEFWQFSALVYNKFDFLSRIEKNRFGDELGWVLTDNIIFYKNLKCEIRKK